MKLNRFAVGVLVLLWMGRVSGQVVPPAIVPLPTPPPGSYLVWDQKAQSLFTAQSYQYKYYEDAAISPDGVGKPLIQISCTPSPTTLPSSGPSPDGAQVPPAAGIRDASGGLWTISPTKQILRNGVQQSGGMGSEIFWSGGKIYVTGTNDHFFRWDTSWVEAPDTLATYRCSALFPVASAGVEHRVALTAGNAGKDSAMSVPYVYTLTVVPTPVTPVKLRTLLRTAPVSK